jgi:ribonucleoside-triphosphate reductase
MTLDQINKRLEELKASRTQIQGMETEVYARIVGYYRSVRNWNKGKKEEFGVRRNYTGLSDQRKTETRQRGFDPALVPTAGGEGFRPEPPRDMENQKNNAQNELGFSAEREMLDYLYFYRKTCPNCPPVAAWLDGSGLNGRRIDVDRESGMLEASRYDISAAPTVIFLDEKGNETGRGSSVAVLNSLAGAAAAAGA